jgi:molecular chaperone DnaK
MLTATVYCVSVKKLNEFGDKVSATHKETIQNRLADLKEAHKSEDLDKIDAATKELNDAWHAASQEMYAQTQGGGDAGNGAYQDPNQGQQSGGASEAQDVEFEEVKS